LLAATFSIARDPFGQTAWCRPRMSQVLGITILLLIQSSNDELLVCVLGPRKARESVKHFGPAPGVPHSKTK